MSFAVRKPTFEDARAIADLHVQTWREAYGHLLPQDFFTAEYVRVRHDMWNQILSAPRDDWSIRIAERDGRLIGFAMSGQSFGPEGEHLPRVRQLYSIYVLATDHGTGAGQALFDATLGDQPAMLWVAKQNPRAIAFYVRNGFAFDGIEQTDERAGDMVEARMVR